MNASEEADEGSPALTDDRKALAGMVLQLFEHWQLTDADRAGLLGLPVADENALVRFRSGEMLGVDVDLKARVELLLSIHSRLRILFPRNRDLAYRWPTAPNRALGGRTPVAVAQEQGMVGLRLIRSYLEEAAWP